MNNRIRCKNRLPGIALLWRALAIALVWVATSWGQIPPAGVPVGGNPTQTLKYAAGATREQSRVAVNTASAWARQAGMSIYRIDQFQMDFRTMRVQFDALRERFNWMANVALELRRPYAANALAELDAGLNIISELFLFLDQQYSAGVLDRATLLRTCRSFEESLQLWSDELKKSQARMGVM